MISLSTKGRLACDHPECNARIDAELILLGTGTFGARPPPGSGWQIAVNGNGPMGAFCNEHRIEQSRLISPSISRLAPPPEGH